MHPWVVGLGTSKIMRVFVLSLGMGNFGMDSAFLQGS